MYLCCLKRQSQKSSSWRPGERSWLSPYRLLKLHQSQSGVFLTGWRSPESCDFLGGSETLVVCCWRPSWDSSSLGRSRRRCSSLATSWNEQTSAATLVELWNWPLRLWTRGWCPFGLFLVHCADSWGWSSVDPTSQCCRRPGRGASRRPRPPIGCLKHPDCSPERLS